MLEPEPAVVIPEPVPIELPPEAPKLPLDVQPVVEPAVIQAPVSITTLEAVALPAEVEPVHETTVKAAPVAGRLPGVSVPEVAIPQVVMTMPGQAHGIVRVRAEPEPAEVTAQSEPTVVEVPSVDEVETSQPVLASPEIAAHGVILPEPMADQKYELFEEEVATQDVFVEHADLPQLLPDEPIAIYDRLAEAVRDELLPAPETEPVPSTAETTEVAPLAVVVAMPVEVEQRLIEYSGTAEPEAATVVEQLLVTIETKAIKLKELTIDQVLPEVMAEAEAEIIELYEQLLEQIGITDLPERERLVQHFIARLHIEIEHATAETAQRIIGDKEGTHERKRYLSTSLSQSLSAISHRLSHAIGQLTLSNAQLDYS